MKFVSPSHFTDPDAAARKLVQIANASEAVGPVPSRARAGGHIGLDVAARVRNLCEVHAWRCRTVRLMAAKGWQRAFEIRYSCGASPVHHAVGFRALHHQAAQHEAGRDGSVAELGGPTLFARIGVMRALNRHVERVFDPSRKDHHWGKRRLARDRNLSGTSPCSNSRSGVALVA